MPKVITTHGNSSMQRKRKPKAKATCDCEYHYDLVIAIGKDTKGARVIAVTTDDGPLVFGPPPDSTASDTAEIVAGLIRHLGD